MRLSSVIIEVTRKCNMTCEHCCRGNAENMDISDETLQAFFSKIKGAYIDSLTITGGEPSLVPERIKAVLKYAKKNKVSVGYFYMVTNAKTCPDSFLKVILDMYMYSQDKDSFQVQYSNDDFHDDLNNEIICKLSAFRFVSPKNHEDYPLTSKNLINQGRAADYFGGRDVSLSHFTFDDDGINEGMLYLNCQGNVLTECDLSYETQELKSLILFNVNEDFDIMASVEKWNNFIDTLQDGTVAELQQIEYEREEERAKRYAVA